MAASSWRQLDLDDDSREKLRVLAFEERRTSGVILHAILEDIAIASERELEDAIEADPGLPEHADRRRSKVKVENKLWTSLKAKVKGKPMNISALVRGWLHAEPPR